MCDPRLQYVLDLDLDLFVHPVVVSEKDRSSRASSAEHQVDSEAAVRDALGKLGLSPDAPIPGVVFDFHQDSYYRWRDLIRQGRLKTPFHVIPVDAHSDMGNGMILSRLFEHWINEPDKLGADPHLNSTTYLAFALTNRWLAALINIRRREYPPDIVAPFFKNCDHGTRRLETKRFAPGGIAEACDSYFTRAKYQPDYEIPYAYGYLDELKKMPRRPDFVFVARSP